MREDTEKSKSTPRHERATRRNVRSSERAARVREARVAPDRADARHPVEARRAVAEEDARAEEREAARAASGGFSIEGFFTAIGDFILKHLKPIAVIAVVVALFFAIYGPARTYYCAWRAGFALQEQLDALNASNDKYKSDIQSLQTREGIEDEARRRGYVTDGETKVVQENAPDDSGDSAASSGDAASQPWYIDLGDKFFNYVEN